MRDYADLIKRLNEFSAEHEMHGGITAEAADAIEELQKVLDAVNDAHNEGYDVGYWAGRRDYEPKWIPVTERLPEPKQKVLVATYRGGVYYGFMEQRGKFYTANNMLADSWCWELDVTHWMPMPEPPMMDGGDTNG